MENRRQFLNRSAALAASIFLNPAITRSAAGLTFKAGLQLWSVREFIGKDLKGVIGEVSKAGYQEVETYGYSKESKFWGASPTEFKALLSSNGLSCPSGHFGVDGMFSTHKFDELHDVIDAAHVVGLKYITIPFIGEQYRKSAADMVKLAKEMTRAGALCKEAGLKLAYHNHNFEWNKVGETSLFQTMLKETDPSAVFFELDLYWVIRAGQNPIKVLSDHPGRFPMWHVKDMDKVKPELNTEIGSGSIDFKEIFKQAKAAGLKHVFMEQENFSMDPVQSITKSCTYMKNNLLG